MSKSNLTMARQIAQAAIAFEQRRTGNHMPKSVTVVLSEGTLVITLHEALSPAERALAKSPAGAAQVQEFHRQLFAGSSHSLRKEINRITGMEVREATAQVEPSTGAVVQAFTTGAVVQVFQLSGSAPTETWSGSDPGDEDAKISHADKETKLADLKADDEVTVTYEKKDGKLLVSKIRSERK
jgi:uncharacterized protein YbcI